jgi:anti-sigma factor RsiW
MTCHDARDQFSALTDGALAPGERAALEAHLATCADCRRELQRFRDTVALVRGVAPARAPAGFVERVLEAARPRPWYARLFRGLFLPWPVKLPMEAAAIVLVGIGVALVYRATPNVQRAAYLDPVAPSAGRQSEGVSPPAALRGESPVVREADRAREDKAKDQAQALAKHRPYEDKPEPPRAPAETPPALTSQYAPGPSRDAEPQRPAEPQKPAEGRERREAPAATADERAQASRELLQPRSAPAAPGSRADTSAAKRSAPAVRGAVAFAAPTVSGRLAVSDLDVALRGVTELARRLGAVETYRSDVAGGDTQVLELAVPREAYPELVRELARLGRWEPSREPAELPAQVRVVLQITR